MIGVDPLHAGILIFQATLLSSLQVVGRFVAVDIPVPSGPRHWGQSAKDVEAAITVDRSRVRLNDFTAGVRARVAGYGLAIYCFKMPRFTRLLRRRATDSRLSQTASV